MKKVIISCVLFVSVFAIYFAYSSNSIKNTTEATSDDVNITKVEQEKVYSEATFPSYSFNELKSKALLIVKGTPVQVADEYMVEGDIPFTEFEFKVNNVYSGNKTVESKMITVLQDGNQLNEFLDHPLMELNKEHILFLEKSSDGHLIMMGGPNGKFTYNSDSDKFESLSGIVIDDSLREY